MITVWGRATSSNVQKVMWTAAELGTAVERHNVGGAFGGLNTAEYRALNPHMRIPTVRFEDGVTMWESNAVVRFMARRDPARTLWPLGGQAEADAEMWAEWAHHACAFHVTALFWAVVRTAPSQRDGNLVHRHLKAATEALTLADGILAERPFLAGPSLTIADIIFGHILYRYYEMDLDRTALPNVASYYSRLTERSAYEEHVMVDFSSLRATG